MNRAGSTPCRIVIDLKRDADPNVVINQLYQYTPCQITVSMINIALVNRQPRTMGLKELIQHFIEHRKEVITRRTQVPASQGAAARAYSRRADLRRLRHRRNHPPDPQQQDARGSDRKADARRASASTRTATGRQAAAAHHAAASGDFRGRAGRTGAAVPRVAAQAEAIGRLQLIQLVGLEIEKLVGEYKQVAEEIEEYEADPRR